MRGARISTLSILLFYRILISQFVTFILFLVISVFLYSHQVSASAISWLQDGQAIIESSTKIRNPPAQCTTTKKWVVGLNDTRDVCVQTYGSFQFTTVNYTGSIFKAAVSYGFDQNMYLVTDGICGGYYDDCKYIPDKDIMIMRYHVGVYRTDFAIFKDFSKKLVQTKNIFNQVTGYTFPHGKNSADFVIPNSETKSYDVSENGQWIVVELKDAGIARISTNDFNIKKFTNQHYPYYAGSDPHMESSITNDGSWVFVGGPNVDSNIYEINSTCGLNTTADGDMADKNYKECSSISINDLLGNEASGLNYTSQPSFSNDGGEIEIFLVYYNQSKNQIINLQAPGYVSKRLDYLALGDSYSSGEGDTDQTSTGQKHYLASTDINGDYPNNIPREKCHQSWRAWPFLLADHYIISVGKKFETIACSGAQIYDIDSLNSVNYEGQGRGDALIMWSDGGRPRLKGITNKDSLKLQSLSDFTPGRQKQIEFVKKYKPRAITLTIGGNDVDFGGILGKCIYQVSCEESSVEGRKKLGAIIEKQFNKLSSLYSEIQKASPATKVYVLGYPQIILDRDDAECPISTASLDVEERKLMVAGYWYINQVIKTAAKKAGVKYIDTSNALDGHRLCESDKPYANGVIAGAFSKDERQESFHPNAKGNTAMANSAFGIIGNQGLTNYTHYPSGPGNSVTENDIPNSDYLQTASSPTNITEHQNMTETTLTRSRPTNISLDSYSLKPSSSAILVLHSNPTNLGSYTVNEDGSLNENVVIPNNIPVGYHTLFVSGQTYSGENIDFEQTVLVKNNNPSDTDDNGVQDGQQACGTFAFSSGQDKDHDGVDDACDPIIEDVKYQKNDDKTATEKNTQKYDRAKKYTNGDSTGNSEQAATPEFSKSNNQYNKAFNSNSKIEDNGKNTQSSAQNNINYLVTVLSLGSFITTIGCIAVWLL